MLKILLSTWGISSIVVAAILFLTWYLLCAKKILAVNSKIAKVLQAESSDAALKESELLAPAWKNFEKTLTKVGDKIYSTTDAAEFFNPQNLTRGMNMTFWQSYGGIFTGLGILGTFAGLTFGLSGVDMTSGDIDTLKGGIAQLLSGVESAFVTSLVGIFCALVYSWIHHLLMKNFQGNVQKLADKLDEKFPRRSAEDWLAENYSEAQNQTSALKNISEQVATENSWLEKNYSEAQSQTTELQTVSADIKNIGEQVAEAIYNGLDEKLGTYVDKICAAIEKLSSGGADKVGEVFADRVGSQMDRFSAALDRFSESIDEKLKNANEISKIMNEQLLNTLKDLDETLKQHAKTSADERNAERKKFSDALESLIGTLNEVAGKIKTNADAANEQANKDREEHVNQNREDREQFLTLLAGLIKTMNEVAEKFKTQQTGHLENFETLINILLADLKDFAEKQKEFLDKSTTSNAAQIYEALKAFREIVDSHNKTMQGTFKQVQNLLDDTEKFLRQVSNAGNSLSQAAEPVKESTRKLANNLAETSAQLNNLANANQTTRQNLSDLTDRLKTFVSNFNGIADELERSTKIIHDSLENYNVKTNAGLKEKLEAFDKSMTQAFGYLNGLVEDLNAAADDLKKIRR